MKKIILIAICLLSVKGFSQKSINDYQYLILPLQYDFLKGKDQYRLNSLTRYLFKEEGFTVFFDEEQLPEDLFKDRCKAMYGNVKKVKGGFLKTNLQIEIKDCFGNLIVESDLGSTKEKQFDKAYAIALKKAFETLKYLEYRYEPRVAEDVVVNSTTASEATNAEAKEAELKRLQKEVEELKLEKEKVAKEEAEAKKQAELKANKEQDQAKKKMDDLRREAEMIVEEKQDVKSEVSKTSDLLYAQEIEGGYQLVDSEPKKVMILLKTAAPDVYSVKGKDAIVFKEDGNWVYSENTGTSKIKKNLNIKF
ncbi:hypothetical protein Q2T40_06560 [Winogradskyella maritima]|uniref:Uncharacterized protein n=1 Tax=Winogradskyella maritima TaxID=1517766 RepID=A0ABV8ANR5_9FLAO|nr:hypothetical protein [Winogradskyella maritima]